MQWYHPNGLIIKKNNPQKQKPVYPLTIGSLVLFLMRVVGGKKALVKDTRRRSHSDRSCFIRSYSSFVISPFA